MKLSNSTLAVLNTNFAEACKDFQNKTIAYKDATEFEDASPRTQQRLKTLLGKTLSGTGTSPDRVLGAQTTSHATLIGPNPNLPGVAAPKNDVARALLGLPALTLDPSTRAIRRREWEQEEKIQRIENSSYRASEEPNRGPGFLFSGEYDPWK
jgi:hypothetical protein